jgi:dipeptidyl aminopeptidase/acylaminoacyl peptidase
VPDARVQAAIDNWAPRFTSQGVDPNDFRATTARIERWEEWLDAWSETASVHQALSEEARDQGRLRTAGEAFVRAAVCFHFAKFVWVLDAERNRETTERAKAALYAAHELLDPTAERIEAPFDGGHVVGNLRRPRDVDKAPLVVLIPGLDSTKEEFFHWENVFLTRGMATLSVDGPGQGETGYQMPIRPDYEATVAAILDAVSARGQGDVDLERVGAAGVSMGGYYAPRAAAFEPRIRAVAGVSGPYDMGAHWDALPSLTRETLQHHTGAGSPEEARAKAGELSLEGVAERIAQPCLVITGRHDRLIPWEDTKRIADEAPNATWVLYDDGNHVCNNIPYKYRPLVGDWMAEQLA